MKPLDQADELRGYYKDKDVVAKYMRKRTTQPLNGFLHRRQVAFLNRAVIARQLGRVLEIACGPGRLTAEIENVEQGVAVDFSPSMLQEARRRTNDAGHWAFLRSDAFVLPFRSASFDGAYTLRFVRHFHLEDRRRLYAEIGRVLRPGGVFMLDALNRDVSLPHRAQRGLGSYQIYDVLYDRRELEGELEEAGFRVVAIEGILKRFGLQRPLNRLRRVRLGGLARVMIAALEMLPGDQPETWMVLCERKG
jgi:ubiquinone/menaquinone biosynthesis C-methylase UbiE